ncbi:MAG: sulfite exporter TauE/SafE family protein [Clostridiales bacterium]|nr:sulfite exporter TauE/SafE family protein [Clostridiales bacterium]
MELTWQMYLIVCPLVFLAGLIDSVAGGGGLISLPAYYMAGLNPALAAGTNKLSAGLGTLASSAKFIRSRKVDWRVGLIAAVGAFPGSWLGSMLLKHIPEDTVRVLMIAAIPLVACVVLRRRDSLDAKGLLPRSLTMPASLAIGLVIGFYDGLVGPGTGTFLILCFTMLLGMEGVMASGTAKIVNLTSNIAALASLALSGDVLIGLGLPAALCGMAGNWLGASLTVKRGTGFIRGVLLVVLALLLVKMVVDVLPGA